MPEQVLKMNKTGNAGTTAEQLASVRGASLCATPLFTCPECGSHDVDGSEDCNNINNYWNCTCKNCGHRWEW